MKKFCAATVFIAVGLFAATATAESDNCDPKGNYPYFERRTNWLSFTDVVNGLQLVAKFYTQTVENEDGSASFQLEIVKEGATDLTLAQLTRARIGLWPDCAPGSVPNGGSKFQINLNGDEIDQDNLVFQIPVTDMPIPNCLDLDSICMVGAFKGFVGPLETALRISQQPTGSECPGLTPPGPNGIRQCPISLQWSEGTPTPTPTPVADS